MILAVFETTDIIYGINSPLFERQEIRDGKTDWVDMLTGETSETKKFDGPAYFYINIFSLARN